MVQRPTGTLCRDEEGIEETLPVELFLGDRGKRKGIWTFGPVHPPRLDLGRRCVFDGVHKATAPSHNTVSRALWLGKGRPYHMIELRNGLSEAAPGDNSYQVPEYSKGFYKKGFTRALAIYGLKRTVLSMDLPVPLKPVPIYHKECYREKEKRRRKGVDAEDVRRLELWKPATPLPLTIPVEEDSSVKLPPIDKGKARVGTDASSRPLSSGSSDSRTAGDNGPFKKSSNRGQAKV